MAGLEGCHFPLRPLVIHVNFQVIPGHNPDPSAFKFFLSDGGSDGGFLAFSVQGATGQEAASDKFKDGAIGTGQVSSSGSWMDWGMGLVIVFTLSREREVYDVGLN